jgi:hypothetical protein
MADTHKFGGKKIAMIAFIAGVLLFQIFFWTILYPRNHTAPESVTTECKTDSLQNVIDSLSVELQSQAQKFDNTEKKYKEILFEYELGIDRIKNYHPRAYEDFHRILAYREDYSREAEIENKKRLNEYNR